MFSLMLFAAPVHATTIDEAKEQAEVLEKDKEEAQAKQQEITGKLSDLGVKMDQTAKEIEQKKAEIKKAEDDLVAAKLDESRQYDDMKKRIRYMYENGQINVLEIFSQSKDISDMLNKIEYAREISEYDRGKLDEFTQVRLDVEKREKTLNEEYDKLGKLQQELEGQKTELETTLSAANLKIADLDKKIVANAAELDRLVKEAQEAERLRTEREAAVAAAAAAAAAAASSSYIPAAGPPVVSGNGTFTHPCPNSYKSSYFGEIREFEPGGHKGNDYAAPTGTPTYAAAAGKVVIAGFSSSAGNWVVIDHGNGLVTKYMHHSALAVSANQYVEKGQQIGYVGSTGQSTGPHLHFQVEVNGVPVNPDTYL